MDVRNLNLATRPISELFGDNPELLYEMPKFQREYVWDKRQWEKFFGDLTEDAQGHFLGTIIGIEPKTVLEPRIIVIDGQQRLTTISLYLAALFSHIRRFKGALNEDQQTDFNTLKRRLVQKSPGKLLRVIPQVQNNNQADYKWLLGEIDVTVEKYVEPDSAKKRKIYLAYIYFYKQIKTYVESEEEQLPALFKLLESVMSAILVVITVKSYSEAFQLFESLNNRGQDLKKPDLLKNVILSKLSEDINIDDYYYGKWTQIIGNVGGVEAEQERFFRINYNAFRKEYNDGDGTYPIAKYANQGNLLDVYVELTKKDPKRLLETACNNSNLYAQITLKNPEKLSKKLFKALRNLNDAEGSTSIILIMHLMKYQESLQLKDDDLVRILFALTVFQVRRNMTKMPPTNRMIPFFNDLVEEIDKGTLVAKNLVSYVLDKLREFSAGDDLFAKELRGDVYNSNKSTTTLILKLLAVDAMSAEDERDLWQEDNGIPVWSVEHILPQGANLPPEWITMIAGGDDSTAFDIQKKYVHKLGNLTITGFNSNLSNRPFANKRDMKNDNGKFIGYKNGLNLNSDVADKDAWTVETIVARTDRLVADILKLFVI